MSIVTLESIERALRAFVIRATGLPDASVYWEGDDPNAAQGATPRVTMNLPTILRRGRDWLVREPNAITFEPKTITAVDVPTSALTIPGHGLGTGDGPHQYTGNIGGLEAATDYWAIVVDEDTIKPAESFRDARAGTPATLSSAGSGSRTLVSTDDTRTAGAELIVKARGTRTIHWSLQAYARKSIRDDGARALLQRVVDSYRLPSYLRMFRAAKIGLNEFGQVRTTGGVIGAVTFEARAVLDVTLNVPSEITETGSYADRLAVTNTDTGDTDVID